MSNSFVTIPRALALLLALIGIAGLMSFTRNQDAPAHPVHLAPHGAPSTAQKSAVVPVSSTTKPLPGATAVATEPSLATVTWHEDLKSLVDRARVSADADFRNGVLDAAGKCSIVLSGEAVGPDHFQATYGAEFGAVVYQRWNLARARIQGFCARAGYDALPGQSLEQRASWKSGSLTEALSTAQRDGRIEDQRALLSRALADPGMQPQALRSWVLGADQYFDGRTAAKFNFAERSEIAQLILVHLDGGRNPESLWPELQCAAFGHCLSVVQPVGMPDDRRARIYAAAAEFHRRLIEQRWNELLPQ